MKKILVCLVVGVLVMGGVAYAQDAPKRTVDQVQMEYDAAMWRLTTATQEIKAKLEEMQKKLMNDPAFVEKQKTAQRLKKELDSMKGGESNGK